MFSKFYKFLNNSLSYFKKKHLWIPTICILLVAVGAVVALTVGGSQSNNTKLTAHVLGQSTSRNPSTSNTQTDLSDGSQNNGSTGSSVQNKTGNSTDAQHGIASNKTVTSTADSSGSGQPTTNGDNNNSAPGTNSGTTPSQPATFATFTDASSGTDPIIVAKANGTMTGWGVKWFGESNVCSAVYGVSMAICSGTTTIDTTDTTVTLDLAQLFPAATNGLLKAGVGQSMLIYVGDESTPNQYFPYNFELTENECINSGPTGWVYSVCF